MKNLCAKTRPESNPYEVWENKAAGWKWKILKRYQSPEKEKDNPFARVFCKVYSPFCPEGELGDVYVKDIVSQAEKVS